MIAWARRLWLRLRDWWSPPPPPPKPTKAANQITADMVTKRALELFLQRMDAIARTSRASEEGLANSGKIGTTLRIRLPEHYTVSVSESPISDRAAPTKH